MELETLKTKLTEWAGLALQNPQELTPTAVQTATEQTLEILAGREMLTFRILDIAMFRLHLALKSKPNETEIEMYKAAIKALDKVPLPVPAVPASVSCIVRGRVSEW